MAQPHEHGDASPIDVCVQTLVSVPAQACWVTTLPSPNNTPASRAGVLSPGGLYKKASPFAILVMGFGLPCPWSPQSPRFDGVWSWYAVGGSSTHRDVVDRLGPASGVAGAGRHIGRISPPYVAMEPRMTQAVSYYPGLTIVPETHSK